LQCPIARLLAAGPVAAHNERLERLGDRATRGFRVGCWMVTGGRSKRQTGIVLHVNARGGDDCPEITVVWSNTEDVVKIVQRGEDQLDSLVRYRKNYAIRTATPPHHFTYEQLRDSWCAHLSRSLSRRATH